MQTADNIDFRVLSWDWKSQPDIAAIDASITVVYDGIHRPLIQSVPNTGMDSVAVIVSSGPINPQQAWQQYADNDYNDSDEQLDNLHLVLDTLEALLVKAETYFGAPAINDVPPRVVELLNYRKTIKEKNVT